MTIDVNTHNKWKRVFKTKFKKNTQAQLIAFLAVLFWSSIASAFKLSLRYMSVPELVFYASASSLLFLFIAVVVLKKCSLVRSLSQQQFLSLAGLGLLNPFLYYLLLLNAYDQLPAQMAQSINYLWGIVLALLAVPLLKHKLQTGDVFALALGLIGVVIIATAGDLSSFDFQNPLGILLALVSTVVFALYWIFASKHDIDPVVLLFVAFLVATPCAGIYMLLTVGWQPVQQQGLMGAVYLGIFEMGFTFLLWLKALKLTDNASRIAMLIYLSPLLSFVFIHYFVGETIYWTTLLGFGCILFGIIVQKLTAKT